jgi:hypothetical protein
MTDVAAQGRLAEAQTALHELMLGKRTVKVMVDGQSIEFTATNRADLEAYIARLQAQVAGRPAFRALPVVF